MFTGEKAAITVRQLITHRTGLVWQPTWLHRDADDSVLPFLATLAPVFPIGSEHRYSDVNMMLAGAIVEQVSGTRLNAFVTDAIHRPLGMADTGYLPDPALRGRIACDARTATRTEYEMVVDRTAEGALQGMDSVVVPHTGTRTATTPWSARSTTATAGTDGMGWPGHAGLFSTARDLATFSEA